MWTSIERNGPRIVIRLRKDYRVAGRLHDLKLGRHARFAADRRYRIGVASAHQWPTARITHDAARVKARHGPDADLRIPYPSCGSAICSSLLCLGRQLRKSSVLRIDDERRPQARSDRALPPVHAVLFPVVVDVLRIDFGVS